MQTVALNGLSNGLPKKDQSLREQKEKLLLPQSWNADWPIENSSPTGPKQVLQ